MIKTLMGTAVSAAVVFGAMMVQPKPAQALVCGNCATEWTQLLNWFLLGKQLVQDETQTAEMISQGVELYDQGVNIKLMMERGLYPNVIMRSGRIVEDLMETQASIGEQTIIWEPNGMIANHEAMYPEELPPDPQMILAYKELQHAHVRNTSLNSKAVTAQVMSEMADLQAREEELEAEAERCPGQTCVADVQRQREVLALEMAKKQSIMEASRLIADQAAADYVAGAKERADANRRIDTDGLATGKPSGQIGAGTGFMVTGGGR